MSGNTRNEKSLYATNKINFPSTSCSLPFNISNILNHTISLNSYHGNIFKANARKDKRDLNKKSKDEILSLKKLSAKKLSEDSQKKSNITSESNEESLEEDDQDKEYDLYESKGDDYEIEINENDCSYKKFDQNGFAKNLQKPNSDEIEHNKIDRKEYFANLCRVFGILDPQSFEKNKQENFFRSLLASHQTQIPATKSQNSPNDVASSWPQQTSSSENLTATANLNLQNLLEIKSSSNFKIQLSQTIINVYKHSKFQ